MSRLQAVFPEDRSEINLSPMLDVIFIMLIFFIVVATFIREVGIPIDLPAAVDRNPDHGENPKASLSVMAANDVPIRDTIVAVDAGYGIGNSVVTIIPLDP